MPATRPVWLTGAAEPFPVVLHPATGPVGVVLCPPFGWEEMSSYRPRRGWAQAFADAGIPAARLDYPGQGDAGGGPEAPGRVAAWTDAIAVTAAWLRAEAGCSRVVAVGISVGGLLALRAAADGAPVDDIVLWAVPATGKAFTRELRAFGRMESATLQPDDQSLTEQSLPEGALAAGGYLLSRETRAGLDALAVPALPGAGARRALLLERDGIAPPESVVTGLREQGVAVELAPGRGYGRMLTEPQFAQLPDEVVARSVAWVGALGPAEDAAAGARPAPVAAREVPIAGPGGEPLTERFVEYAGARGTAAGILTSPPAGTPGNGTVAVLLGGTGHRIGPNRMWVEIARRWAARGVPTVRLDVVGAGESTSPSPADVPTLYAPDAVGEIRALLEEITQEHQAERVVCVGLCAGAYWALHASLSGLPHVAPLMVNLPTLLWDRSGHAERAVQHYRRELLRAETWRRLRRGDVAVGNVLQTVAQRVRDRVGRGGRPAAAETPAGVLDALHDQGIGAWMFFSGREALHEQLERDGVFGERTRYPGLHVDVVPGQSDLHTLRPLWLQHRLHELVDAALDAQLRRPRA